MLFQICCLTKTLRRHPRPDLRITLPQSQAKPLISKCAFNHMLRQRLRLFGYLTDPVRAVTMAYCDSVAERQGCPCAGRDMRADQWPLAVASYRILQQNISDVGLGLPHSVFLHLPAVEGDLITTEVQVPIGKHADQLRQQRRHRRVRSISCRVQRTLRPGGASVRVIAVDQQVRIPAPPAQRVACTLPKSESASGCEAGG